jgi:HlyD family secretion protein
MKRLFCSALVCVTLGACDQARDALLITSEPPALTVTRGDLEEHVTLSGELEASNSVELGAPKTDVWDISIRWLAEDGVPVKKGDPLVEFDNTAILEKMADYELGVVQAGNELASQQATTATETEEKKFAVETARIDVEKNDLDASAPDGVISRYDKEKAILALERAKVAIGAAKDDLEGSTQGGKLEIDVKRIAYDKSKRQYQGAREQIDSMSVKAPRDGVMLVATHPWEGRKFQVGDIAFPGLTVAKLPDLSKIVVKASLSDVDDGRVHAGMTVSCTIDAYPGRPIQGTVRTVNPVAREPDRRSSRRFFAVLVELDASDAEILRPGLSAQVEILTGRAEDSLIAPRAGLDLDASPPIARLADGTDVEIELGLCNAQACAITSGLSEGDTLRRQERTR